MAFLLAIYSSLVTVSTYKIKYKYLIMIKMVMHIDIANELTFYIAKNNIPETKDKRITFPFNVITLFFTKFSRYL